MNLISRHVQRPLELGARGSFGTLLEGDFRANAGTKQGPFEGRVGDVPVFNVAVPVIGRDFWVFELTAARRPSEVH